MANRFTGVEVVEWDGQTPFPPVAPAGKARMVYETASNCVAISISGGTYQCLLFGTQAGGSGPIAAGVQDIPTGAGTFRLSPWNEAVTAGAAIDEWSAPADGTLRNFFVRHNVVGVGPDITYEWFVNGAATGVVVALAASGTVGSDLVNSFDILQGQTVELRATHGGITTSPTRIRATATFGLGAFGDDYLSVDSPALFTTAGGGVAPTPFVTKPGALLVTPVLTGRYRIAWHALVGSSSTATNVQGRLFNVTDAVIVGGRQQFEPEASGGVLPDVEDFNGYKEVVFAGASKTFAVQVSKAAGSNPSSVSMSNALIELWRIGP